MGGIGFFNVLIAVLREAQLLCMRELFLSPVFVKCPRSLKSILKCIATDFTYDKGNDFMGVQDDDNLKYLNFHFKIISFAQMGSRDLYCFLFDDRAEQGVVVVYGH